MEEYNKKFGLTPPPGFFDKGGTCHRTLRKIFRLQSSNVGDQNEVEASITHEDKEKKGKGTKIEEKTEVTRHPSHPWTLVQGFYAQMGGFVLDSTGVYPDFLPESRTTLDLESFRFLLIFAALPFFEPPRKSSKIVRLDE